MNKETKRAFLEAVKSSEEDTLNKKVKSVAKSMGIPYSKNLYKNASKWLRGINMRGEDESNAGFDSTTGTHTNQYDVSQPKLSALKPDGTIMTIDEFCRHYGLDPQHSKSYKLVTHTGVPYYNIASKNLDDDCDLPTAEELKKWIAEDLITIKTQPIASTAPKGNKTIVVTLSDLHFGAYIDNLIKTHDYSIGILVDKLKDAVGVINSHGAEEVHVHILGDLIESFTGLNHKNSWKGLQKGMIGAELIKLTCKVLDEVFLSKVVNLKSIYVIGGNHDRLTSDKAEDTESGAADLICWGLDLMGYPIVFNPFVLNHVVDGISYILLHGHDAISKKSTKDICWDYGNQGMFNFVTEGHLHSIIEKLSASQVKAFNTTKDDSVDHRRIVCPSLFTGNSFSERLGYTSNSGFIISENNGKGVPNVYFYAL